MSVRVGRLPAVWVLTDRHLAAPRSLAEAVADLAAGVPDGIAVVLREKDLAPAERVALADELRPIVAGSGGLLVVASGPDPLPPVEVDGLHLTATEPFPADRPALVGRSCHTLEAVVAAAAEGCDYVTVSPVFASQSKPGYGTPAPRTWEDGGDHPGLALLRAACAAVPVPVIALGGIAPGNAGRCLGAGAVGVATLGRAMTAAARHAGAPFTELLVSGDAERRGTPKERVGEGEGWS